MPAEPDPEPAPASSPDDRSSVLAVLLALLSSVGSANDAEDHGYKEEAERMRSESCQAILDLLDDHPFLAQGLPTLHREVVSGHIMGFGWADLYQKAATLLEQRETAR